MAAHEKNNLFSMRPVGRIKNSLSKPMHRPDPDAEPDVKREQGKANQRIIKKTISQLIIDPAYEALLDGIEEFSHIMIIYWPHLLPENERHIQKVHPMGRKDMPEQGIFATRSPARPNPILVSTVRLLKRDKNILQVIGLEALNDSPILDIKPYIAFDEADGEPVFPDWIKKLHEELKSE
ncbi:MAG: tRNA (N6-threonylcarbamoyladenosine(37)-N6)-methyltransferase TrmO [Proteobacteria bacterium]|nr:tRNA (N6-threonylcarbamoyladenosine(37)-N6)-methyltransferase TrmO [Pseudomonadota bacterium]